MADACARAHAVTGDRLAGDGIELAAMVPRCQRRRRPMWDPRTGGGYDGLQANGVNLNQGTESTLALITTLQHARELHRR